MAAVGIKNYVIKYISGNSINYGCKFDNYIVNSINGMAIKENSV